MPPQGSRLGVDFMSESGAFTTCFHCVPARRWINRQQLVVIEYLKAQNRMLREPRSREYVRVVALRIAPTIQSRAKVAYTSKVALSLRAAIG